MCSCRTRRRRWRTRPGSSCRASATSAPPARSTRSGPRPSSACCGKGGRCSASVWACSGCSRAAKKRRIARAWGCSRAGATASRGDASSAIKMPHVGWNSLAMTRDDSIVDGVAGGVAGLFHPQLRGAGHRRYRGRRPSTARRLPRSCSAVRSPASSFIPRSPATSVSRSSATSCRCAG